VNPETVKKLIQLNREFYQTFALQFSATRQRLQPGVICIINQLPKAANVLDLGCGNGQLWRTMKRSGHKGLYVGLDFSAELLQEAAGDDKPNPGIANSSTQGFESPAPGREQAVFLEADLATPHWDQPIRDKRFDVGLAFAVLHHLPGHELRIQVLRKLYSLLTTGGRFHLSVWQFLNSSRLRARIQPWSSISLTEEGVDTGDYLLDWRQGGYGLRYVHQFSDAELNTLARECGFSVAETFHSDGEGGKLGLYQTWIKNRS
jgi:SAM-dependent methyltransferase